MPINFQLFDLFTNPSFSQKKNSAHVYGYRENTRKMKKQVKNKTERDKISSCCSWGKNKITSMCSLFIMKTEYKSYYRLGKIHTIRNISTTMHTYCIQCIIIHILYYFVVYDFLCYYFAACGHASPIALVPLHCICALVQGTTLLPLLHAETCIFSLIFYLQKEFCICFL